MRSTCDEASSFLIMLLKKKKTKKQNEQTRTSTETLRLTLIWLPQPQIAKRDCLGPLITQVFDRTLCETVRESIWTGIMWVTIH